MLYLYQGIVHVTPGLQVESVWRNLVSTFTEDWKIARIGTYVYFAYTKKDNHYWRIPPDERKERIFSYYSIGEDWEDIKDYKALEGLVEVQRFIEFYMEHTLTDNDRNEDAFRRKAEQLRKTLLENDNYEEDEKISKALKAASQLAEEYSMKAQLEAGKEQGEGCPLYLFEIPEGKKDPHLKLKL